MQPRRFLFTMFNTRTYPYQTSCPYLLDSRLGALKLWRQSILQYTTIGVPQKPTINHSSLDTPPKVLERIKRRVCEAYNVAGTRADID